MPLSIKKNETSLESLEAKVTETFKGIGFGVLNTIDFQSTLQEKIGKDIGEYKLLQICNPHLAYDAITIEAAIGLQLPCNVLLRKEGEAYAIDVQSPLESIPANAPDQLKDMASELTDKIESLLKEM